MCSFASLILAFFADLSLPNVFHVLFFFCVFVASPWQMTISGFNVNRTRSRAMAMWGSQAGLAKGRRKSLHQLGASVGTCSRTHSRAGVLLSTHSFPSPRDRRFSGLKIEVALIVLIFHVGDNHEKNDDDQRRQFRVPWSFLVCVPLCVGAILRKMAFLKRIVEFFLIDFRFCFQFAWVRPWEKYGFQKADCWGCHDRFVFCFGCLIISSHFISSFGFRLRSFLKIRKTR